MKLPFECFSHNFCANYEIWKIRVVVLLLVINIMSVLFSMLFQTMIVSVLYLLYMYPHVLQRRDVSSQYDGWMPSEMRFTCSQFLPTKVRDICKFATIQCENALKWTKEPMKTTCCLTPCPQNYNIARTPIPAPPHRRRIPQQVCGGYKALGKPPRGCFSAFKTATRRDFEHFVRSVTIWLASISQLTTMKRGGSCSNMIDSLMRMLTSITNWCWILWSQSTTPSILSSVPSPTRPNWRLYTVRWRSAPLAPHGWHLLC